MTSSPCHLLPAIKNRNVVYLPANKMIHSTLTRIDTCLHLACGSYVTIKTKDEKSLAAVSSEIIQPQIWQTQQVFKQFLKNLEEPKLASYLFSSPSDILQPLYRTLGIWQLNFQNNNPCSLTEWQSNWRETTAKIIRFAIDEALDAIDAFNRHALDRIEDVSTLTPLVQNIRRHINTISCDREVDLAGSVSKLNENSILSTLSLHIAKERQGVRLSAILKFCDHLEQDFEMSQLIPSLLQFNYRIEDTFKNVNHYNAILINYLWTTKKEVISGYISPAKREYLKKQSDIPLKTRIEEILKESYELTLYHSAYSDRHAQELIYRLLGYIDAAVAAQLAYLEQVLVVSDTPSHNIHFLTEMEAIHLYIIHLTRHIDNIHAACSLVKKVNHLKGMFDLYSAHKQQIPPYIEPFSPESYYLKLMYDKLEIHWDYLCIQSTIVELTFLLKSYPSYICNHEKKTWNFDELTRSKERLNQYQDLIEVIATLPLFLENEPSTSASLGSFANLVHSCRLYIHK